MATSESSFDVLLSRAPAASSSDTITVVGAIARSPHAGKFVLGTTDGQTFTLDIIAVKKHRVLAESVGQFLVEIELDTTKISPELRTAFAAVLNPVFQNVLGQHATIAEQFTVAETVAEVLHNPATSPLWADYGPGFGNPGLGTASPFVAAAAHQAPAETMAKLQSIAFLPKIISDHLDVSRTFFFGLDLWPKPVPDDRIPQ